MSLRIAPKLTTLPSPPLITAILEDIEEQASSKKENLIGKFFDSSIPSMVETGGEYFSKIKKYYWTIFFSPVIFT